MSHWGERVGIAQMLLSFGEQLEAQPFLHKSSASLPLMHSHQGSRVIPMHRDSKIQELLAKYRESIVKPTVEQLCGREPDLARSSRVT